MQTGWTPAEYRSTLRRKKALGAVYQDYYDRIQRNCVPGRTLELGGGGGYLSETVRDAVATDIVSAPWLDVVTDAHDLPFAANSFDNVVMLDVLHHLAYPRRFFAEAARVLRPGGRVVMIEPAVTPVSWLAYRFFHEEPLDLGAEPLASGPMNGPRPEDANQAIPHLIFKRHAAAFARAFPALKIIGVKRLSLWAYAMTGGFRDWCLLPARSVRSALWLEDKLMPCLGRLGAFRMIIVLERRDAPVD